jgi:hypothetical protein
MAAPQLMRAIVLNKTHRRPFSRNRLRRRDVEKVIVDRHGIVPETDDADIYLIAAATCFGRITRENGKRPTHEVFAIWCEKWAPHFGDAERADILDQAIDNHLRTDDDWGRLLRLSDAERTRLGITTIGGYDVDRKARVKRSVANRRERDRLGAAERRKAKGAMPRAVYLAKSLSATKPWEQMGVSKRTYYRRIGTVGTGPSPCPSYGKGRRTCAKAKDSLTEARPTPKTKNHDVVSNVALATLISANEIDRKRYKSRIGPSSKPTKDQLKYAMDAGFDRARVGNMFEWFVNHHVAISSYAADWNEMWETWVCNKVDLDHETDRRARAERWMMKAG